TVLQDAEAVIAAISPRPLQLSQGGILIHLEHAARLAPGLRLPVIADLPPGLTRWSGRLRCLFHAPCLPSASKSSSTRWLQVSSPASHALCGACQERKSHRAHGKSNVLEIARKHPVSA